MTPSGGIDEAEDVYVKVTFAGLATLKKAQPIVRNYGDRIKASPPIQGSTTRKIVVYRGQPGDIKGLVKALTAELNTDGPRIAAQPISPAEVNKLLKKHKVESVDEAGYTVSTGPRAGAPGKSIKVFSGKRQVAHAEAVGKDIVGLSFTKKPVQVTTHTKVIRALEAAGFVVDREDWPFSKFKESVDEANIVTLRTGYGFLVVLTATNADYYWTGKKWTTKRENAMEYNSKSEAQTAAKEAKTKGRSQATVESVDAFTAKLQMPGNVARIKKWLAGQIEFEGKTMTRAAAIEKAVKDGASLEKKPKHGMQVWLKKSKTWLPTKVIGDMGRNYAAWLMKHANEAIEAPTAPHPFDVELKKSGLPAGVRVPLIAYTRKWIKKVGAPGMDDYDEFEVTKAGEKIKVVLRKATKKFQFLVSKDDLREDVDEAWRPGTRVKWLGEAGRMLYGMVMKMIDRTLALVRLDGSLQDIEVPNRLLGKV